MHEQIDMTELYAKYPALKEVEDVIDPRYERRRHILYHIPRFKRGAEIGVFTGQFSELMLQIAKPTSYFAVDPYYTAYGRYFPDGVNTLRMESSKPWQDMRRPCIGSKDFRVLK